MLVSIVLATYNNLDLAKNALSSILKQQQVDMEIIVTDDSTNVDIHNYVSNLNNPLIKYHHNKQAKGAVSNWNNGLKKATGDIIIMFHHDEAFSNKFHLSQIVKTFKDGNDIVISPVRVFTNGNLRPNKLLYAHNKEKLLEYPSVLFAFNYIGPCACIAFKRTNMNLFDEQLHWLVDVECYYRLLKASEKNKVLSDEFVIHSWHGHENQISCKINVLANIAQDMKVIKSKYNNKTSILIALYVHLFVQRIKKFLHR